MGRFTSPLYPGPYRNQSECIWDVSVPRGHQIELRFDAIDLGSREICPSTYLEISDVSIAGEISSVTRYCGGVSNYSMIFELFEVFFFFFALFFFLSNFIFYFFNHRIIRMSIILLKKRYK